MFLNNCIYCVECSDLLWSGNTFSLPGIIFFSIANSSDLFYNLFQNEDRIEVTDEDILTEIHQLTMAVKAAQLDDYPESHGVS